MARKPRLKAPRTRAEIETQIGLLNKELEVIEAAERDRIGRIALSSGLADLALSDAELEAVLRQLAATFPKTAVA